MEAVGDFRVALILGGTRSGKSRLALALAKARGEPRLYIATGEAGDDEMAARIAWHRGERGPGWDTLEAPLNLAEAIAGSGSRYAVVVVDCLTLWLSNLLLQGSPEADLEEAFSKLAEVAERAPAPLILVSNEVGLGIVPDNPLARQFRDLAGRLHQRLAQAADLVIMTLAGLPLVLKQTPQKDF